MKLITAIVRSEKLDGIIDAVIGNNGRGLTVTTVRGFGRQFGELADRTLGADMAVGGLPLYPRPSCSARSAWTSSCLTRTCRPWWTPSLSTPAPG